MVDLLPEIEVVEGDEFNSHPDDAKLMGPAALQSFQAGEQLPRARIKTPLVRSACTFPAAAAAPYRACMQAPVPFLIMPTACHAL